MWPGWSRNSSETIWLNIGYDYQISGERSYVSLSGKKGARDEGCRAGEGVQVNILAFLAISGYR